MKIYNRRIRYRNRYSNGSFTFSQSFDNGETLNQRVNDNGYQEYVTEKSITDLPFEEYVLPADCLSQSTSFSNVEYLDDNSSATPQDEIRFDLFDDHKKDAGFRSFYDEEKPANTNQYHSKSENTANNNITGSLSAFEESIGLHDATAAKDTLPVKEDDFIKDMQAILSGEKVFNAQTKSVESALPETARQQSSAPALPVENKHAIFDQIAQSMQYAKAYDLGSIDLEKRFADFDTLEETKKVQPPQPKRVPQMVKAQDETVRSEEEFLKDLNAIIAGSNGTEIQPANVIYTPPSPAATGQLPVINYNTGQAMSVSPYAYAQTPAAPAVIAIADAIQIGLGAVAVIQAQVSASQGTFTLSYDKAQRMLTNEARQAMPGAQTTKTKYSRQLFNIGGNNLIIPLATASVIIEWEGNPYGEISTAVIRRDLAASTEWSKSAANISISKIDRIPLPGSDPRTWPLVFTYEGTYDPAGNGYFEFSGEFEINAFGGLNFVRHGAFSRAGIDLAVLGKAEEYVRKGANVIVPVPAIPQEQLNYLKSKLP